MSPSFPPLPEYSFVTLPPGLAQFHHLPVHVPVRIHRQEEVERNGYDFAEGARVMAEVLEEAPGVPGAYLYSLFVQKWPKWKEVEPYFASGRVVEAIPKLVEILDIDPECPLTSFQLGYCFRVTGELERSESFYKKALRMAPAAGWIYPNLGRTYLAMGNRPAAAEVFWKALEALPGDPFVLEQLTALGELFTLPDGKGGKPAFVKREVYESKMAEWIGRTDRPQDLMDLGWKLLRDKLPELAQRCFQKARDLGQGKPGPQEAWAMGVGLAHLEAGRFKEAEASLLDHLDRHPGSAAAHLNLFKAYLAQDERDLAWEEIQAAVRLEPDRLEALRQLYFLFLRTERAEEGLEWLDALALESPQSYGPHLLKAWALADQDRWAEAQESAREALRRSPHNEEVLLFLTAELGRRGQREEVLRLLEEEPGPLPLSLTINHSLALSQEGRAAEARRVLEGFLERKGASDLEKERVRRLLGEMGR